MPVRSSVGQGHIVRGSVRSSQGCGPIPNAKVELWPEVDGGHPDVYRATVFTGGAGEYSFEGPATDHIHMRISAPGFRAIFSNLYHPEGRSEGRFDVVLVPDGTATP